MCCLCRVLIYSQFTRTLDILEDWVTGRGWGYERIDGGSQLTMEKHVTLSNILRAGQGSLLEF